MIDTCGENAMYLIYGSVILFCGGAIVGILMERRSWHKKLIDRGVAKYHWMNAKWIWADDGTPLKGPSAGGKK